MSIEQMRWLLMWITPPAVNEEQVAEHAGLARFGVRSVSIPRRASDCATPAGRLPVISMPPRGRFNRVGDVVWRGRPERSHRRVIARARAPVASPP